MLSAVHFQRTLRHGDSSPQEFTSRRPEALHWGLVITHGLRSAGHAFPGVRFLGRPGRRIFGGGIRVRESASYCKVFVRYSKVLF
jgi:hypothetical protein